MKSIATLSVATVFSAVSACGGEGCSHGHPEGHINPEATASHILVKTAEEAEELKTRFTDITAEGEVKELFSQLAKEHSECPSKENGGSLGHFESGQMVEEFEKVIFDQENAIMTVHGPVETQFGQHLILIENRLNADGSKDGIVPVVKKATASHILVDEEEKINELKEQILAAEDQAAEFSKVAAEHSKCPSGAQAGGSLGSFRQGQMVPEFDEVIFGSENELNVVHGPIKTQFGFHLIFITERSGVESEAVEVEVSAEGEVAEEKKEEDAASDVSTEVPEEVSEEVSSEEQCVDEAAEL